MLPCTIEFSQKLNPAYKGNRNKNSPTKSSNGKPNSYYASVDKGRIAFFSDQRSQAPISELKVSEYSPKLDTGSSSLTLINKESKDLSVTINAATSVLEKLQQPFQSNSEGKAKWSLLNDTPYNRPTDSVLTNIDSNTDCKGMLTVVFAIAVLAKGKDIISSHLAHGFLPEGEEGPNDKLLLLFTLVYSVAAIGLLMTVEKLAFKGIIPSRVALAIEMLNALLMGIATTRNYHVYTPHYGKALFNMLFTIISMFKMISYAHFMHDIRKNLPSILGSKDSKAVDISKENLAIVQKYANNPSELVRLTDILYFSLAPVITYQLWYPREESINKKRAFKLVAQSFIFMKLSDYYTVQQVLPALKASTEAFIHGSPGEIAEQLISAASTYLVCFMITFYYMFHLAPNVMAELLRFSNREFYGEWWNCTTVSRFWNRWDLLIHRFFLRDIYRPLLSHGCPKLAASCIVFVCSGIMHEFIFGAPLGRISYYPTFFFSVQAVFIFIENKFSNLCKKYYPANICLYILINIGIIAFSASMIRIQYLELSGRK